MTGAPSPRSPTAIDPISWITLTRIRGSRYYRVHLEQDLWYAWVIAQVYGRRGSPLGRARSTPAATRAAAFLAIAHITKRRRQRGYELLR